MNLQTEQRTLAMMTGFERYSKKTRRAAFVEELNQVVPWGELCALIEPHDPQAGNGRPPIGVEWMQRIYVLQRWFNPPAGSRRDCTTRWRCRQFVGIDLGREPPEEITACKCRHLLEEHNLVSGGGPRAGTAATLLRAPSPVKEEHCAGTPERVYSVRLLGAKIPI
jgi:hypothetical protein